MRSRLWEPSFRSRLSSFLEDRSIRQPYSAKEPPAFLFDIVESAQAYIPSNEAVAAFGVLFVGILCGIDGSGFAGLPITGALAGALSHGTGIDTSMLAAVGQMGSIWSGGGTFIAWSSLVAVAAFVGVSPLELARRNFLPVMAGLIVATVLAVMIW